MHSAWPGKMQGLGLGRTLAAAARKHTQAAVTLASQPFRPTLPARDVAWFD